VESPKEEVEEQLLSRELLPKQLRIAFDRHGEEGGLVPPLEIGD
jgi:hypothetical protein